MYFPLDSISQTSFFIIDAIFFRKKHSDDVKWLLLNIYASRTMQQLPDSSYIILRIKRMKENEFWRWQEKLLQYETRAQ